MEGLPGRAVNAIICTSEREGVEICTHTEVSVPRDSNCSDVATNQGVLQHQRLQGQGQIPHGPLKRTLSCQHLDLGAVMLFSGCSVLFWFLWVLFC